MADTAELDALKRRGRRRLIGAIALVLAAVIVLPMVFDQTPHQGPPAVSVRIPGMDERPFKPKSAPKPASKPAASPASKPAPVSTPVPLKPEAIEGGAQKESARPAPSKAAAESPSTTQSEPAHAAKAAAPEKTEYVVPVAALANREKVAELVRRLKSAKLPHYTEPVDSAAGRVTRVRVGPYSSRESAERAYAKLKRMGLEPGNVTTRAE